MGQVRWWLVGLVLLVPGLAAADSSSQEYARVRQPVDTVGYTHSAEGIAQVVAHASEREGAALAESAAALGLAEGQGVVAGISPHDDYAYAQQAYVHLYSHLHAKHVVLIGVAHKARNYPETHGKLVFDSFDAWQGPHGDVPISPLRGPLLAGLGEGDALAHDELQSVEHSVEAMVPFLQHQRRDVEIVPILVPYMTFERITELADRLAALLAAAMKDSGLVLGEDVAILISSDSVHYGDQDWGGRSYADFGVDGAGYDRAVDRDRLLIKNHLEGELSIARQEALFHELVQEDVQQYNITWCGRFSIPFGLALLYELSVELERPMPSGVLLKYGTTLDPGCSDPGVEGLDVTGPANLHHWVGFAALGYR